MTFEEFKAIAERELPRIEGIVDDVKKLGASRIGISVRPNGHIDLDINMEKDNLHFCAWHSGGRKTGNATVCMFDTSKKGHWTTVKEGEISYHKEDGKNEG